MPWKPYYDVHFLLSPTEVGLWFLPVLGAAVTWFFARRATKKKLNEVQLRTAELHQSLEREKKAADAKMQFLANMSHEIRTPMNAIIGFSELLHGENLTGEQIGYLGRIRSNSDLLLQLIDDILDLSKFEAGKVPIEKTNFSLITLLDDLIHTFSLSAEKKGLSLATELLTPIPQNIFSDSVRLRQILTNLIGNAVKFTQAGGIKMRLSYAAPSSGSKKSSLLIEVEDTGIGIAEADQIKLFQTFSQGDSSINRKFGGTGLGLVLSRRFAEAMDGHLILHSSKPGAGACFRMTLHLDPVAGTPFLTKLAKEKSEDNFISLPKQDWSLKQTRLLLAEDSLDNEILIRHFLQGYNFKIEVAVNGIEAVKMALSNNYDCVLMDVQMPLMDGLEATRRLRAQGYQKPIIALTAHTLQQEVEKSLNAGCNLHITKPINRKFLLEAIHAQTQRQ